MPASEPTSLSLLPERIRLPRGRSALAADQVAASQRGRILQATVETIAERGYAETSVQDLIGRARVSRKAFYALFSDKQDAFAQAHVASSHQLFAIISAAVRPLAMEDWRVRHRAAINAYLNAFVSAPAYAVTFMVELPMAGTRLLDQRDWTVERHARGLRTFADEAHRARLQSEPDRRPPSDAAIIGAVGAADELATRQIRSGDIAGLPGLLDPIVEIQHAVLAGSA